MSAQVKRFPKPIDRTPEENARFVKACDLAEQLQHLARKASLLSFAVTGIMELERNQGFWPLRDAADEISSELAAIAQGLTDEG